MNIFCMINTQAAQRYTPYALESFFSYTPWGADDRFYLIDNDRTLDTAAIGRAFPRAQIITNDSPRSFAENMNRAFDEARGCGADFYGLNNDLIFAPGWFEPLAARPSGLVSPVCNAQFPYRANTFEARLNMTLEDYLGHEHEFLGMVSHHREKNSGYRLVPTTAYYCIKIPAAISADVGIFTEGLSKAGWEDIDYTLRCYERGHPLYFALGSYVLHFYGKSTWQIDGKPIEPEPPEIKYYIPPKFLERWGQELADSFAFQNGRGETLLREAEIAGLIHGYSELVRRFARS